MTPPKDEPKAPRNASAETRKPTRPRKPQVNPDIHTFHQGDEDKPENGPIPFRMATEEITIGKKKVVVPKKLGDGNFGMVFEAPSTVANGPVYALKVLYKHRAGGDLSTEKEMGERQRAIKELQLGIDLPAALSKLGPEIETIDPDFPTQGDMQLARLAAPIAYCKNFKSFVGRDALVDGDIAFSSLAYLMPKFDQSLKDQVERPLTKGGSSYGRLLKTTKQQRVRSAIPIATQLARGLQVLHAAGMRHQDIKPANIYCRKGRDNTIDYRLGDLGFLQPHDPGKAGTAAASIDSIGIGTKHYRSIEQVDFCDTAECTLSVDPGGSTATLKTRDPKFLDTIIRKGDLAFFARSASHRLLTVTEVKRQRDQKTTVIKVKKNGPPRSADGTGKPEPEIFIQTDKTQVSFFKNPSAKTDLFGLGAIIFDIVTIGDSPERFYELLRRFDNPTEDIKRLMNQYATWKAGTLENPDLGAVFGRANGGPDRSDTLDPRILTFILKCMMSDASGSFYLQDEGFAAAEKDKADPVNAIKAWKNVLNELEAMTGPLGAAEYDRYDTNVLTRSFAPGVNGRPPPPIQEPDPQPVSTVLESYARGVPPNHGMRSPANLIAAPENERVAYRWMMGGLLIKHLADKVAKMKDEPGKMVSLSPEHLLVTKDSVVFSRVVFDTQDGDTIGERLRARDPILTRVRPFSSQFEPIWWRFGARRVDMTPVAVAASSSAPAQGAKGEKGTSVQTPKQPKPGDVGETLNVVFSYKDFAFGTRDVQPGDYALAAEGSADVFEIIKVLPKNELQVRRMTKSLGHRGLTAVSTNGSLQNSFLIQRPDPVDYYAGMVAIYLFHFLISRGVGQSEPISDFSMSVYGKIAEFPVRFKRPPRCASHNWKGLRDYTIELIVWLSLGGYTTDGKGNTTAAQKLSAIQASVRDWFGKLHDLSTTDRSYDTSDLLYPPKEGVLWGRDQVQLSLFETVDPAVWHSVTDAYLGIKKGLLDRF